MIVPALRARVASLLVALTAYSGGAGTLGTPSVSTIIALLTPDLPLDVS